MLTNEAPPPESGGVGLPLLAAADLQDHLMVANHDLERLQRLLDDATSTLLGHFYGANDHVNQLLTKSAGLPDADTAPIREVMQHLAGAITALQFQDMATQLVNHMQRRLRSCADRLARDTMGDDDDDGVAVVEDGPLRPNPVTQDEMDAGSVELF